jgi:hypothetical protein
MITLTFETKQFRVQISGKTAWIETSEMGCWVFRGMHELPITHDALTRRDRVGLLAVAVKHFDIHGADQGLREALTGIRAKTAIKPAPASVPAKRSPTPGLPTRVSMATVERFGGPLRPPLKPECGLPGGDRTG